MKVEYKEKWELDKLAKNNHQGIIMVVEDFNYTPIEDFLNLEDYLRVLFDYDLNI